MQYDDVDNQMKVINLMWRRWFAGKLKSTGFVGRLVTSIKENQNELKTA